MAGDYLTVVAEMKAKAGREEDLKSELTKLLAPTRKEEGCVQYDFHQSIEEPRLFFFYEKWLSKPHLDKHLQSPHIKAVFAKAPDLLEAAPKIHLVKKVSG